MFDHFVQTNSTLPNEQTGMENPFSPSPAVSPPFALVPLLCFPYVYHPTTSIPLRNKKQGTP